ncbi:MAG: hypothetical protein KF791_18940 [Verrucomicrobiae bacterium]|nr:hypothetical protein [Verrucomicrobiae bacterium]
MNTRCLAPRYCVLLAGMVVLAHPQTAQQLRWIQDGHLELSDGRAGTTYQLEEASALAPGMTWEKVGPPRVATTAGPVGWTVEPAAATRFFRVSASGGDVGIKEAALRVLTEVIRPSEQAGLVLGLRWPEPLAAGAVIRSASPEGPPGAWPVDEPSHFFVVDHAPAQKLGHPFTYVLVGRNTGQLSTRTAFAPPEVDGVGRLSRLRERWNPAVRFFPASFGDETPPLAGFVELEFGDAEPGFPVLPAPPPAVAGAAGAQVPGSRGKPITDCTKTPGRKVAVVIASGADDEIQNDARDMAALLARMGFSITAFNSASNTLSEVTTGIELAGRGLGPCDKFFIYISSHTQLVDDNDDGKPDGLPFRLDYGLGHATKTTWSWLSRHPNSLPALLRTNLSGRINLMLDTCFAEAMPLWLEKDKVEPPPGVEWNIFCSSEAFKTSAGATTLDFLLDYGNDEVHSQYTGRILEQIGAAERAGLVDTDGDGVLSVDEIEAAFLAAQDVVASELFSGQGPKLHQRRGPVPEALEDSVTVAPAQPVRVDVSANDSFQRSATFTLVEEPALHPDLYSWNPATGEMTLTGLTAQSQVTFSYRLRNGNLETDPVRATVRFDPRRNYLEEFLEAVPDSDRLRVPCIQLDGLDYPVYQFLLTNSPTDHCTEPHWHAHRPVFPVNATGAPGRTDPNPPSCGFGTIRERPVILVEVTRDVWADFLLEHLPPF